MGSVAANPEILAAIFRPHQHSATIEPVEIVDIRDDEVLVRVVAAGVCHTDLTFIHGFMALPYAAILGHEGSGIVERIGKNVTKVAAGDPVVLTFMSCGECGNCLQGKPALCDIMGACNAPGHRRDGSSGLTAQDGSVAAHFFGQSSFATYSIANQRNVVKVRKDAPLELLGPLGCGIQTGAGSTLNVLKPKAGDSFMVFGAGSVGLSAMMAAVVLGCSPVIVVEPNAARRRLALELGADHAFDPTETADIVATLRGVTGRGIQHAVDTCGIPAVISQAIQALAVGGKIVVLTGNSIDAAISLPLLDTLGRSISVIGSTEGHSNPDEFIPKLVDLIMARAFPLEKLVRYYPFSEINTALDDAHAGRSIKPILLMSGTEPAR